MKKRKAFSVIAAVTVATLFLSVTPAFAEDSDNNGYDDETGEMIYPVNSDNCTSIVVLGVKGSHGPASSASSELSSQNRAVSNYPSGIDDENSVAYPSVNGEDVTDPNFVTNGWEGVLISRLFNAAAPHIVEKNLSVSYVGVGPEQGFSLEDGYTNPLQYKTSLLSEGSDIAVGVVKYMKEKRVQCPTTRFFLVGYSLGAVVAHLVYALYPGAVAGAYTIGDPMQVPNAASSGPSSTGSDGNGVFYDKGKNVLNPGWTDALESFYDINNFDAERRVMCHSGDNLCDYKFSPFASAPHKNYFDTDLTAEEGEVFDPDEYETEGLALAENLEKLLENYWGFVSYGFDYGISIRNVPTIFHVYHDDYKNEDPINPLYQYELYDNWNQTVPIETSTQEIFYHTYTGEKRNWWVILKIRDLSTGLVVTEFSSDSKLLTFTNDVLKDDPTVAP